MTSIYALGLASEEIARFQREQADYYHRQIRHAEAHRQALYDCLDLMHQMERSKEWQWRRVEFAKAFEMPRLVERDSIKRSGVLWGIDLPNDQTFKFVAPIVEKLEALGYETESTDDTPEIKYRAIVMKKTCGDFAINIHLLAKGGDKCKIVETGEMKPVTRLECDEGEPVI